MILDRVINDLDLDVYGMKTKMTQFGIFFDLEMMFIETEPNSQ